MNGRGLVFGNEYRLGSARIEMRITGTHRARSDGTPCKGNLLLAPQQGVAAAWVLLLVVRLGLERQKRKHPRLLFVLSLHLIIYVVGLLIYGAGLQASCPLGHTDGIIPPINTTQAIYFFRANNDLSCYSKW